MEGCRNKVFSSQAMSHCHKLRYRAVGVSSLKPILFLYLNIKKVILLLITNNLYKPQTFFLIRAILPLICCGVFLGDSHIHLTSIILRPIQFQIFYIFLKGSYTVHMLLKMPLFWTFWTVNLALILIFYIHLTCTIVRPASILSICPIFNLAVFTF